MAGPPRRLGIRELLEGQSSLTFALDMKLKLILIFTIIIVLNSCDGHVRSFKVPLPTARSGASQAEDKQKLIDAITEVASERGFIEYNPVYKTDSSKVIIAFQKQIENGSVRIELHQETKTGIYKYVILDWPSATRSAESVAVESAIREKLKER